MKFVLFQFGSDDDDVVGDDGEFIRREAAHKLYRADWIESRAEVFSPKVYPTDLQ